MHGVHHVLASQQKPLSASEAVGIEPKKNITLDIPLCLCILGMCQDANGFFCAYLRDFAVVNNTGLHTAYQYELLLWYIMDYSITVKATQ